MCCCRDEGTERRFRMIQEAGQERDRMAFRKALETRGDASTAGQLKRLADLYNAGIACALFECCAASVKISSPPSSQLPHAESLPPSLPPSLPRLPPLPLKEICFHLALVLGAITWEELQSARRQSSKEHVDHKDYPSKVSGRRSQSPRLAPRTARP